MLEDYARRNGFPRPTHFTDDGISGTRFDRPGFNAMMAEVEMVVSTTDGQSISLMDLSGAIQREKKSSILKKLKEQPPQSASKRKPQKTKEKEI